ncbi:MAG: ribbon-helix-helix protein, CopG family [Roseobacter sp.]
MSVTLPREAIEKLDKFAKQLRCSRSKVLRVLVESSLNSPSNTLSENLKLPKHRAGAKFDYEEVQRLRQEVGSRAGLDIVPEFIGNEKSQNGHDKKKP